MKAILSVFIVCFFVSCSSSSKVQTQNSDKQKEGSKTSALSVNEQMITETINTYFEGWMTGDTTKLGTAMHRTCQLKNIKDDDVIIYSRSTYLGFFKPRPRRQNAGGRIVSIDVTDDTASAKCEIHTADRLYTDYFNMMKLKDRWYIVDKIASSKPRTTK